VGLLQYGMMHRPETVRHLRASQRSGEGFLSKASPGYRAIFSGW
jgi:hypothetical protein